MVDPRVTNIDTIEAARGALRLRETLFIVLAVLFPALMLLAGIPLTWLLKSTAPLWIMASVFVTLLVGTAIWHQRFRCPRCGEPFFSATKPLSNVCLNCGLELVR